MLCAQMSFGATRDDFKVANELYDEGKFAEAIAAYEKLEPKTAHARFNLGNACFRANQLGRAVLNYERARRLSPRDADILANLKFAQERLGVDAMNTPPKPITRFLQLILHSRTLNEWGAYELCGLWLTLAGVALCIWLKRARAVWITLAVVSFLCLAAGATALGCRVIQHRNSPDAVVLVKQADARFAPLADATVHFKLAEGTKVRVREDRGQWLFVQRADGQDGWVKSGTLERIGLY